MSYRALTWRRRTHFLWRTASADLLIGSAIITAVELGMLRLGDAPLLAAGARDTVRVTAWRGCYLQCVSGGCDRGAHRVRGGGDEGVGRDGSARRRLRRCRHDWTAECPWLHLTAPRARHVRSVSRIAPRRFCVELIYVLMAGEAAREVAGMWYRETGGF